MRPAELAAIRAGDVDVAFRRWEQPRVKVGARMRTAMAELSEGEVRALHGVGPYALRHLRTAMEAAGLAFRTDPDTSPATS